MVAKGRPRSWTGSPEEQIVTVATPVRIGPVKAACSNCNLRELCLPVGLSPEQVGQLAALHGLSLAEKQLDQLLELVGGHPYLVRKALYELANGLPFDSFLQQAPTEAGVFCRHLRGLLRAVEDRPELVDALRQVVNSPEPLKLRSEEAFKLESLGLMVPEGNLQRPRCQLYALYLADRLSR